MLRALRLSPRCWARLIFPGLCLSASLGSAADAPPAGFQQGNALYAAGKYAPASAAYESAVRAGPVSANLFYDLGNAYYRRGERGRAMLNYQRALLLEPAHVEAAANLAYLQGRHTRQNDAGNSWLSRKLDLLEIDLWPLVAAVAGWLGLACLVLAAGSLRRRLAAVGVCFAVCACAIGTAWWRDDGLKNAGRALVLADGSRALYSPNENSQVITRLPLGREVRVLSNQGAWVYVQLADGSPAWLEAANVENIAPKHG